jgi:hypothetical protein
MDRFCGPEGAGRPLSIEAAAHALGAALREVA